jgi:microcompartment protein CcmL/EutN
MKKHPAIAVVEFDEIPTGMSATDAMLKKAPIAFV